MGNAIKRRKLRKLEAWKKLNEKQEEVKVELEETTKEEVKEEVKEQKVEETIIEVKEDPVQLEKPVKKKKSLQAE